MSCYILTLLVISAARPTPGRDVCVWDLHVGVCMGEDNGGAAGRPPPHRLRLAARRPRHVSPAQRETLTPGPQPSGRDLLLSSLPLTHCTPRFRLRNGCQERGNTIDQMGAQRPVGNHQTVLRQQQIINHQPV